MKLTKSSKMKNRKLEIPDEVLETIALVDSF